MDNPYGGLPTELIHQILDTLYDGSHTATLKACSLVDPLFCTLSQMRILSQVILHQENTYLTMGSRPTVFTPTCSPAVHFLQMLNISPHIATYIQSLTIQCDFIAAAGVTGVDHWVASDTALATLLPRLINLRRISISGNRIVFPLKQHKPRLWNTVSQGLTSVFSTNIPSYVLTDLDVTGISLFPVDLLRQCPSLKRLSISSIHFDSEKVIPAANKENLIPQLDYLHLEDLSDLEDMAHCFSTPSFPLDITCLRELSLHPSSQQDLEEIALCSAWAKSVTRLRIHTESAGVLTSYNTLNYVLQYQSAPVPDLQEMDSLKSVVIDAKFTIRIFHHRTLIDYFTSPLPWITSLFTALSGSISLRTKISYLTLNLAFVKFPRELVKLLNWKTLANSVDKFPKPPKLILNITGLNRFDTAELQRDEYLIKLVAKGIIRYTQPDCGK